MKLLSLRPASTALAFVLTSSFTFAAHAAPLVTLDRSGAWVSVQAYGPNIVHVSIAADKAEALKAPGYGIIAEHADASAFKHTAGADGDTFACRAPARSTSRRNWRRSACKSRTPRARPSSA